MSDPSFSTAPSSPVPPATAITSEPAGAPPPRPPRRRRRWLALAGVLAFAAAGIAVWVYVITRPDYRYRAARQAIADGDHDRAWELAALLEEAGDLERADLLRGESLFVRGEYALALERFNRVREDQALRVRAALFSGRCLLQLRQLDEADRVLSWALSQDPEDVDGHRALAAVAYDRGDFHRARAHLAEVARLAPGDGRPYRLQGLIRKFTGDYDGARAAYAKALERDLTDAFRREIYLELAEIANAEKKPAEVLQAIAQLAAVTEQLPPQAASLQGQALLRQGRSAEARAVAAEALQRHPDDANLLALRGEIELNTDRDAKKAVISLEKAAKKEPGNYRIVYLLGQAYSGAGREAEAKEAIARGNKLRKNFEEIDALSRKAMAEPANVEVRMKLGQLWEEMGNRNLSEMWYRAAATRGRD